MGHICDSLKAANITSCEQLKTSDTSNLEGLAADDKTSLNNLRATLDSLYPKLESEQSLKILADDSIIAEVICQFSDNSLDAIHQYQF